jgi:F-type H+-transporting ATPase subunit b
MARVHLRRGLGALALALGVAVAAAPAARAAEEPLSPEAEEILEGIAENSNELGAALEALPEEEREHVIHELELLAEENGSPYYDTHCIPILLEGGTVDECQAAPNQLVPEKNELIWGGFGFLVVFGFLAWKGVPAIKKTMADRTERIRDDLEGAEAAKADANRVLDEYRAQLADAKAESGRIIEEARQQGDAVRKEQEQRLQTELAAMRERAAADVESAKNQAIADLRDEVASLAIGAAEVVIGRNLDRETQTQLVDQYIASVQNRN